MDTSCLTSHLNWAFKINVINIQMPHYATLSDKPSIYDDKVIGYALEYDREDISLSQNSEYFIIYSLASYIALLGIMGTPLVFDTISQSIEATDKGKPKLYYHFWSTIVLIIGGLWGYVS